MRSIASVATAVALSVLASCASPQTARPQIADASLAAEQDRQARYALEHRANDYKRVYDIAERLTRANTEFCRRTQRTIGIRFENLNDYPRDFRASARDLWGLSDMPSVLWVGADTPAERAGVQLRDQLVAVNGRAVAAGRRSSRQVFNLLRDASNAGGPVALTLRRGQDTVNVTVTPELDCAYQVLMVDADEVNASADGNTIVLNRGTLRFVQNDDELALVLGHELAHNAMGHIDAMRQNALMGSIGGAILDGLAAAGGVNTGGAFSRAGGDVGARMFAQAFESEADYVGMYFMARAGYSTVGVEDFWRRMSAEHPQGIRIAYTHPTTAARFLGLEATRQEIAAKAARGEPLRPNMQGEHAVEPTAVNATPAESAAATAPPEQNQQPAPEATPAPDASPPAPETTPVTPASDPPVVAVAPTAP